MATDLRRWISNQRAPFTLALAASLVLVPLFGLQSKSSLPGLAVRAGADPWTILTYPWSINPFASSGALVLLLFMIVWLVQFGTSVEREMDTKRFIFFWLSFTALPGLIALISNAPLAGPWLPATAVVVAWGARNTKATVMLYGILPVSGLWIAILAAGAAVIGYAQNDPASGLLMCLPLALAWLFARDKFPFGFSAGRPARGAKVTVVRGATAYEDSYFENVKDREMEREERERLRKLFEGK